LKPNPPIITLLTDFGLADGYVAAMKGVIVTQAPEARVVDACHAIAPQDVRAGAWVLGQYWSFYPAGTIHIAVVDPEVGTARGALLAEADGQYFLAPDNGLLFWVFRRAERMVTRKLKPAAQRPGPISSVFHGRDVFAWVAGLLAAGKVTVADVTENVPAIEWPDWAEVQIAPGRLTGQVVHIDRFGNIITGITRRQLDETGWKKFEVVAAHVSIDGLARVYADAEEGELLAVVGSSGHLEIAMRNGSAAELLGLSGGARIVVRRKK